MKEGFWKNAGHPELPVPVSSETEMAGKQEFLDKLRKIERRAGKRMFKGWSTCRICKKPNGTVTYLSRGWEWPEGFSHYVEEHNVAPSEAFVNMVMGKPKG